MLEMQITATNNKTVEKSSGETEVIINVIANNQRPYFHQKSYLATVRDNLEPGNVIINSIRVTILHTFLRI